MMRRPLSDLDDGLAGVVPPERGDQGPGRRLEPALRHHGLLGPELAVAHPFRQLDRGLQEALAPAKHLEALNADLLSNEWNMMFLSLNL